MQRRLLAAVPPLKFRIFSRIFPGKITGKFPGFFPINSWNNSGSLIYRGICSVLIGYQDEKDESSCKSVFILAAMIFRMKPDFPLFFICFAMFLLCFPMFFHPGDPVKPALSWGFDPRGPRCRVCLRRRRHVLQRSSEKSLPRFLFNPVNG